MNYAGLEVSVLDVPHVTIRRTMNIEDIKTELAKLEPEADAAWKAFKALEEQALPLRDKWYALHRRCEQLRSAIELLEPKGEP